MPLVLARGGTAPRRGITHDQQAMRQAARRAAREVTARRRAERAAREQRIEHLAVAALTTLQEREDAERRIGEALVEMIDAHRLRLAEVEVRAAYRELTHDVTTRANLEVIATRPVWCAGSRPAWTRWRSLANSLTG